MKPEQEYSPKYWVIHDKRGVDVFILSARKDLDSCEQAFIDSYGFSRWGIVEDDCLMDMFYSDENLEAILIEIKEVTI